MRAELRSKTASLAGTSDLTVVAPIRPGLISALDTVTYKTRVKRVLRALQLGRVSAHEADMTRLLSDAVERVGRIHSVRIVVIEPGDQVMLAATFDGAWESYVRVIWQKVGRLLDLIFCNTVDYVPGGLSTYKEWGAWLRWRQAETPFLYATPGITFEDTVHLRMQERMQRRLGGAAADLACTRARLPSAEEIADDMLFLGTDPSNPLRSHAVASEDVKPLVFRQGLRALVGLYRLSDLFPPGTDDGRYLLRAAHELLPEFSRLLPIYSGGVQRANERFKEQLDWFRDGFITEPFTKVWRAPPERPLLCQPGTIQAGILESHGDCSHGVLLLLAWPSSAAAGRFLARFSPTVVGGPVRAITANLALTAEGLRVAGLSDADMAQLPEEFVQGMEKRASVLGDVHTNHPRRWRLPPRNWHQGVNAADLAEGDTSTPRVELGAVHALLQLRLRMPVTPSGTAGTSTATSTTTSADPSAVARQQLMAQLQHWVGTGGDVAPLSLQWMHRLQDPSAPGQIVEHFGFGDAISNPVFEKSQAGRYFPNHVNVGEALLGYPNAADEGGLALVSPGLRPVLHNGSFLVLRKLRQDLGALERVLEPVAPPERDLVLAKMMGRWPLNHAQSNLPLVPLADPAQLNDFNYRGDGDGAKCPFHAHIRRANPRSMVLGDLKTTTVDGSRPPVIFRRGMSYGPWFDRKQTNAKARAQNLQEERGMVFMAYNASIAEQFEVVQRWLSGGNSSGAGSAVSDPFMGVAQAGRPRDYRFEHQGHTVRLRLDGADDFLAEPEPLVRLEWGAYFFAPSTLALQALAQRALALAGPAPLQCPFHRAPVAPPWDAERGLAAIGVLRSVEAADGAEAAKAAWKAALEDPDAATSFSAASIWAAVRHFHGGVLRTPYGVLVGSKALVDSVLHDPQCNLSANGYLPRMRRSYGEIFLGYDAGSGDYEQASKESIEALAALDRSDTFSVARQRTAEKLTALVQRSVRMSQEDELSRLAIGLAPRSSLRFDLTFDLRELVDHLLASFCEHWFGLSTDGGHFDRGGFSWTWNSSMPARYPGHYMSPSRYFFQPHPGPEVERLGAAHGQSLAKAMGAYLKEFGPRISKPMVTKVLGSPMAAKDPGFAARTLNGIIMGFVPTVDGVLRRVLNEWLNDGTLWSLRARHALMSNPDFDRAVDDAFGRAMQLRTAPDVLWRTASVSHRMGAQGDQGVDVAPGDVVVLGLASAMQQSLEEGSPALTHGFGGNRRGPQAPTHACPAYDVALEMMKGFLVALLTSPEALRAGPGPMMLAVDGVAPFQMPSAAGPHQAVLAQGQQAVARRADAVAAASLQDAPQAARRQKKIRLWAVGDSWLADIALNYPDLVTALRPYGFDVANQRLRHADAGYPLAQLTTPTFLERFEHELIESVDTIPDGAQGILAPQVVLMGGGGNDITSPHDRPHQTPLYAVLQAGAAKAITAAEAINQAELDRFVVAMRTHYVALLDVITRHTPVPVLIHNYDHPIPDGRPAVFWMNAWLKPVFALRGMHNPVLNAQVMRVLIDALNNMVQALAAQRRALGHNVHHLDLRGLLARQPGFAQNHTLYWNDELHPTVLGYAVLAQEITARVAALGVRAR